MPRNSRPETESNMNSHKSRARKRRLAHAAGLLRTPYLIQVREAWVACLRAGWRDDLPERPDEFFATRGFPLNP